MSPRGEITHVSDTALMVAACRALETEEPDAFVQDPFAARLAGERGRAILAAAPEPGRLRFGVAMRSRFLDELLLEALASNGIETVVSVGCGLDARPWRLDLAPSLRWIEVDFPDMLEYKEALLSAETPRCRRERFSADVNDAAQRAALYAAVGPAPALMITEGLLMYLPAATVDALAAEVGGECGVAHWISDVTTAAFRKAIQMNHSQSLRDVQAPDALEGEETLGVLRSRGWETAALRSYYRDIGFAMGRIRRMRGEVARPGGPPPIPPGDPTGVHRFHRA